ncbi:MAG: DUF1345 domain-containing protein [Novosphingobium sp.]
MTARRGLLADLRSALGSKVAPPRFVLFVVLLGAVALAWRLFHAAPPGDALVIGFDLAAVVFMATLLPLLRDRSAATMRRHAAQNDANRFFVLALTGATALAILMAISAELPAAKQGHVLAIAKLIGTLGLSWAFTNVIFALHYAHMHYARASDGKGDHGGFDFPGTAEPDYWDFVYFAFTAGMSFAASDVNVTSGAVRRVVVLHSLLSFVFNIGVLAFSINVLAGAAG